MHLQNQKDPEWVTLGKRRYHVEQKGHVIRTRVERNERHERWGWGWHMALQETQDKKSGLWNQRWGGNIISWCISCVCRVYETRDHERISRVEWELRRHDLWEDDIKTLLTLSLLDQSRTFCSLCWSIFISFFEIRTRMVMVPPMMVVMLGLPSVLFRRWNSIKTCSRTSSRRTRKTHGSDCTRVTLKGKEWEFA